MLHINEFLCGSTKVFNEHCNAITDECKSCVTCTYDWVNELTRAGIVMQGIEVPYVLRNITQMRLARKQHSKCEMVIEFFSFDNLKS